MVVIKSANQYPVHALLSHEGNVMYRIPPYQREYSWQKAQWEELFKDLFFVTILGGVLFPQERIRSYLVKSIKILRLKRPEFEELALQSRLEVKRHSRLSSHSAIWS